MIGNFPHPYVVFLFYLCCGYACSHSRTFRWPCHKHKDHILPPLLLRSGSTRGLVVSFCAQLKSRPPRGKTSDRTARLWFLRPFTSAARGRAIAHTWLVFDHATLDEHWMERRENWVSIVRSSNVLNWSSQNNKLQFATNNLYPFVRNSITI